MWLEETLTIQDIQQALADARKNGGACLVGPVADDDQMLVAVLAEKLGQVLRSLARGVDALVLKRLQRQRMDRVRLRPRAERLEPVAAMMSQQRLGHLTAAGIARAEKQHFRLFFVACHDTPSIRWVVDLWARTVA